MTAMLNIPSSVGLAFCLLILPFVFHVGRAGNKEGDEVLALFPLLSACFYLIFISISMHLNLTLQMFLEATVSFPDCDRALCGHR